MNYYERHLGDYARNAGHLSMIEHGAYCLLLDRYYITEQGIPADQAHRLCRARSREERAAVDAVLAEFFTLDGGAWINGRAAREVIKAQTKIEAARANGKLGGRPKRNQPEPTGLLPGLDSLTQDKALQTPDTRHHTPTKEKKEARKRAPACPDDVAVGVWADWLALRRAKKAPVSETTLAEARKESDKAAMPLEAFLCAWIARGSQGFAAEWIKPANRAAPLSAVPTEPAWRTEQRAQMAGFAGAVMAKRPAPNTVETVDDTPARFLG